MLFVDFHAIGYAVPRGCCISMQSSTMWVGIETSGCSGSPAQYNEAKGGRLKQAQ